MARRSAASRIFVTTAYLAMRHFFVIRGQTFGGEPNFDERNFALAAGLPTVLVAIAATAFLILLFVWLFRTAQRGSRILFAVALIAGIVGGNMLWTSLAPPVLATSE